MNEAHLHLVFNHFPLVGVIIGILVLAIGMAAKKPQVISTALGILIFTTLTTVASIATGEGAEEIVEEIPGMSHYAIHEHEEIAEKFTLLMYAIGLASIASLFLTYKKWAKVNLLNIGILILALVASVLSISVGNTGGEIRHTEIIGE